MPQTIGKQSAALFSSALFRPLILGRGSARLDKVTSQLRRLLSIADGSPNSVVVRAAYRKIASEYRSEYFYKNMITSKILVGRHRAANTGLISEFKIGTSVADCVLINGRGMVYEIKTEFDSPGKLRGQLSNYYRAFPYVTVVVHSRAADRYLKVLDGSPVGLTVLRADGALSPVKDATFEANSFDAKTIFDTLRLSEVSVILRRWFGELPEFPSGLRYSEFLSLAQQMPLRCLQDEMQAALKSRGPRNCRALLLSSNEDLAPLRAVVSSLDPTAEQGQNLVAWLATRGE